MKLESLLPHRGHMLLIDALLDWDDKTARARAVMAPSHPFALADGRVPATVGLEMMAQTVAAWAGVRGQDQGEGPRVGYLLACRSYDSEVAAFAAGSELEIRVEELIRQDNGFGSYRGEIHQGGECLARGRLSVMEQPPQALSGENE
ncbi:putative hotdog family 3-hydroxylacyl-ACP dehydratase [Natronospira proteinivora]|uniref:Hotdog family 3-hydroxylacyl-ACP dehydratase n=1 Tax=Natronospira proteinivora TaxID=1807133 RepID=A0ABT1GCQ2_9GAMM|nr:hotdog family protein [Natronospira proteinivora]MCP1727717.1 putative hotdog family 3-hydroxylacyl-ACP dehydratase [Natronospira proteinivora]